MVTTDNICDIFSLCFEFSAFGNLVCVSSEAVGNRTVQKSVGELL